MVNTLRYYVKSEGIKLPDGTIFGAETNEIIRVVSESGIRGFLVYEVFGNDVVNIFGDGSRVEWLKMKNAVNDRISYQISIGNKVYLDDREVTEV